MMQAQTIIDYLQETQTVFERYCKTYNPDSDFEMQSWSTPLGALSATVSRGPVLEKASAAYCDLVIDTPPVLAEKMENNVDKMQCLVLEINLFPNNPRIPKSYIELRANIAGDYVVLAGGTDIFPYFDASAESEVFALNIRKTCEDHGQDYNKLRDVRVQFFQSKYRNCPVGSHAGIYFFSLEQEAFPFFKAMTDTFFSTYADMLNRKKDGDISPADKQLQHRLHGQWAQWVMTEDEGTRFGLEKGIPPEALLDVILPPVAVF